MSKSRERVQRPRLLGKLEHEYGSLTGLTFESKLPGKSRPLLFTNEAVVRITRLSERTIEGVAEVTVGLGEDGVIRMRSTWQLRARLRKGVTRSDIESDPGALIAPIAGRVAVLFSTLTRELLQSTPIVVNPAWLTEKGHVKCEWTLTENVPQEDQDTPRQPSE